MRQSECRLDLPAPATRVMAQLIVGRGVQGNSGRPDWPLRHPKPDAPDRSRWSGEATPIYLAFIQSNISSFTVNSLQHLH